MPRVFGYHVQTAKEANSSELFAEPLKIVPVFFLVALVASLMYVWFVEHLRPLLLQGVGRSSFVFWCCTSTLWWICYLRCVFTCPGSVPNVKEDPQWQYPGNVDAAAVQTVEGMEVKRTGERRHCKWCAMYKPDRCHHCRVCRTCILKMDHHCPWIINCVGFNNYKYFYLLLLYSCISCWYMAFTMLRSVKNATEPTTEFTSMFLLFFCETMLLFMGTAVTLFFLFHSWLVAQAMTTIEYCEKKIKPGVRFDSQYNRGLYENFVAVLGPSIWLWLLPVGGPQGDGLNLGEGHLLKDGTGQFASHSEYTACTQAAAGNAGGTVYSTLRQADGQQGAVRTGSDGWSDGSDASRLRPGEVPFRSYSCP